MMTNACFSSWAGTEFMHCDAPRDRQEVWAAFRVAREQRRIGAAVAGLQQVTVGGVAESRDSPQAAMSPARGRIGSKLRGRTGRRPGGGGFPMRRPGMRSAARSRSLSGHNYANGLSQVRV
jgi:hypothetical protein